MKRQFLLSMGLSFLAGLGGCDRLWNSSLVCAGGSQPDTDTMGKPVCPGSTTDMMNPTTGSDGGTPWTPTTVLITENFTSDVAGLRVVGAVPGGAAKNLFVFSHGKPNFDIASGGCAGTAVAFAPAKVTGLSGTVSDANAGTLADNTAFYYVITQQSSVGSLIYIVSAQNLTSTGMASPLTGLTRPGFSNIEFHGQLSYLTIVQTDAPQLVFGQLAADQVTFNTPIQLGTGSKDPVTQMARADFTQDGAVDYALSQYAALDEGDLVGCSGTGSLGCTPLIAVSEQKGDLLAVGEFADKAPQLVRVARLPAAVTADQGVATVGLSTFKSATKMLTTATASFSLLPGYVPLFVAASPSLHGGDSANTILVAAMLPASDKGVIFARQVDSTGQLTGQADPLILDGIPTAMIVDNYPCADRPQLLISQVSNGVTTIRAYELPKF